MKFREPVPANSSRRSCGSCTVAVYDRLALWHPGIVIEAPQLETATDTKLSNRCQDQPSYQHTCSGDQNRSSSRTSNGPTSVPKKEGRKSVNHGPEQPRNDQYHVLLSSSQVELPPSKQ